jgi:hypothetical protein
LFGNRIRLGAAVLAQMHAGGPAGELVTCVGSDRVPNQQKHCHRREFSIVRALRFSSDDKTPGTHPENL